MRLGILAPESAFWGETSRSGFAASSRLTGAPVGTSLGVDDALGLGTSSARAGPSHGANHTLEADDALEAGHGDKLSPALGAEPG